MRFTGLLWQMDLSHEAKQKERDTDLDHRDEARRMEKGNELGPEIWARFLSGEDGRMSNS